MGPGNQDSLALSLRDIPTLQTEEPPITANLPDTEISTATHVNGSLRRSEASGVSSKGRRRGSQTSPNLTTDDVVHPPPYNPDFAAEWLLEGTG